MRSTISEPCNTLGSTTVWKSARTYWNWSWSKTLKTVDQTFWFANKQPRSKHTWRTYERRFMHQSNFQTTRFHIIQFQCHATRVFVSWSIELQFASKELARSMAEPTTADVETLKRCIRFLLKYPRCIQSCRKTGDCAQADHVLQWLKLCRMSAEAGRARVHARSSTENFSWNLRKQHRWLSASRVLKLNSTQQSRQQLRELVAFQWCEILE